MMKTSKILININKISEIDEYKKIGDFNFLFAVKGYSIGYNDFALEEIPEDAYLFINRIMDNKTINKLKNDIPLLKKFRGVIFEDVGVYNLLKDEEIPLIWYQNHFGTNINSINFWLEKGCLSTVISNEITREEIKTIVNSAIKPVVMTLFAKNQIMYSRRTLLTNFNKYKNLPNNKEMVLGEKHTKNEFLARENDYGVALFNNEYFNYQEIIPEIDDNVLYYLVLNLDYEPNKIMETIESGMGCKGFLDKKTVYKMAEYDDR